MNPVFVQQTQALSWMTIASKLAPAETFFAWRTSISPGVFFLSLTQFKRVLYVRYLGRESRLASSILDQDSQTKECEPIVNQYS